MNVRRAQLKDIERINKLLEQVLMVHYNGRPDIFKKGTTKYTNQELIDIIHNDKTPILVLVDEQDIVLGYAFCMLQQYLEHNILTEVKTLYIDDLCIDENIRGKHLGKRLYDEVIDFAKQLKCYNVTLNVWSCNQSAIAFYERCGLLPQKVGMEIIL